MGPVALFVFHPHPSLPPSRGKAIIASDALGQAAGAGPLAVFVFAALALDGLVGAVGGEDGVCDERDDCAGLRAGALGGFTPILTFPHQGGRDFALSLTLSWGERAFAIRR